MKMMDKYETLVAMCAIVRYWDRMGFRDHIVASSLVVMTVRTITRHALARLWRVLERGLAESAWALGLDVPDPTLTSLTAGFQRDIEAAARRVEWLMDNDDSVVRDAADRRVAQCMHCFVDVWDSVTHADTDNALECMVVHDPNMRHVSVLHHRRVLLAAFDMVRSSALDIVRTAERVLGMEPVSCADCGYVMRDRCMAEFTDLFGEGTATAPPS